MKKYMVKTNTPVIFNGKDCGNLINFYRFEADSEQGAINLWLNQPQHDGEYIEYVRVYNSNSTKSKNNSIKFEKDLFRMEGLMGDYYA